MSFSGPYFLVCIEHYASSPVDETPGDALEQVHQLTPTETKKEAGRFHMYVCQEKA